MTPGQIARGARSLVTGLAIGVAAALTIQQAWALSKFPTHTTSRYTLVRGAVTSVATGEAAGDVESDKWKESGGMSYDVNGRSVSPSVLRGGFALYREGP